MYQRSEEDLAHLPTELSFVPRGDYTYQLLFNSTTTRPNPAYSESPNRTSNCNGIDTVMPVESAVLASDESRYSDRWYFGRQGRAIPRMG